MFLFIYTYANLSTLQLTAAGVVLAMYAGIVGWSRIYCGLHSMTDVAGGFLFGITIALSWWYVSKIAGLWSVVVEYRK
jgi:membrane-associated phospholipid phosphatase